MQALTETDAAPLSTAATHHPSRQW